MKNLIYSAVALGLFILLGSNAAAQSPTPDETLFLQLQTQATSDQATEQFFKYRLKNADTRLYLVAHLPEKILQGPEGDYALVWVNEVRLAGAFRIQETIPALVKWMDQPMDALDGQTLSSLDRLFSFPAGRALAKMGEPAIPVLADALKTGDYRRRWVACRALNMIGTPAALHALVDHLEHESSPALKTYIQKVTQGRNADASTP